ncbi:hypothetical protein ACQ4PT_047870 [Festuca glaucescens]
MGLASPSFWAAQLPAACSPCSGFWKGSHALCHFVLLSRNSHPILSGVSVWPTQSRRPLPLLPPAHPASPHSPSRNTYHTHTHTLTHKAREVKIEMATELTAAQLRAYDGSDASKPIYVAIRGKVYDVSAGRGFYGPGGDYAIFAGREASRALAKMSKDSGDVSGDLAGLSEKELGVLADWETKFQAKYPVVGRLA